MARGWLLRASREGRPLTTGTSFTGFRRVSRDGCKCNQYSLRVPILDPVLVAVRCGVMQLHVVQRKKRVCAGATGLQVACCSRVRGSSRLITADFSNTVLFSLVQAQTLTGTNVNVCNFPVTL